MKKLKTLLLLSMLALVVGGLSSCSSDDDDSPKFNDVTLVAGSTQQIANSNGINWQSENKLIAEVENGTIKAYRVGEVRVASDKGSFMVKVTPQYSYYTEPNLNFGASMQSVKNQMKGYSLISEDSKSLTYKGSGYTSGYLYSFENSALKYSWILTSSSYSTEVANWVAERYVYVTDTDEYIGLITPDKKILVIVMPMKVGNSWYYTIGYQKYEKNSSNAKVNRAPSLIEDSGDNYTLKAEAYFDDLRSKL